MIKKTVPFIILAVLILVGASWLILNERKQNNPETVKSELISLSDEDLSAYRIALDQVQEGTIEHSLQLMGKVVFDQEAKSVIVPPVHGTVEKIFVKKGASVKKGDPIASILSKEAASYKLDYHKGLKDIELLKAMKESEELLHQKGFISDQQLLKAKLDFDTQEINNKFFLDRIETLGFIEMDFFGEPLTRYYLRAPIDGIVIENDLVLGDLVDPEKAILTVADLNKLHLEISLNSDEIKQVKPGDLVKIDDQIGHIESILPLIDSKTLKSYALASFEGFLTPGSWTPVKIITQVDKVPMVIKKCSVVDIDGCKKVFVKCEDGYVPTEIEIGQEDGECYEVIGQLKPGDMIASENLFVLKSEISKEEE